VSLCCEWTAVKITPLQRDAVSLPCRCWDCENCGPKRRSQLMAQAASGLPTTLITLTVNPRVGESVNDRLRLLSHSWKLIVKRLRQVKGKDYIQYMAFVEKTKAGEPHLHILARTGWIPQKWLSAVMDELMRSPIVDIRRIQTVRAAVAYVAKYVTKAPAKFGASKRYWQSRAYGLNPLPKPDPGGSDFEPWVLEKRHINLVSLSWTLDGWMGRRDERGGLVFWPVGAGPPTLVGFGGY